MCLRGRGLDKLVVSLVCVILCIRGKRKARLVSGCAMCMIMCCMFNFWFWFKKFN